MLGRHRHVPLLPALLLAALALLLPPPRAHANFVYWTSDFPQNSIGRAKINGTAVNDNFITGLSSARGVAVDSKFIYWADTNAERIGRANLDGTGVNPNFIVLPADTRPTGVAVTGSSIYWGSDGSGGFGRIGRANIDGTNPDNNFATPPTPSFTCGIAADQSFVYWLDTAKKTIGRAALGGGSSAPGFAAVPSADCGLAVDSSFLYWGTAENTVGRLPVGGGAPQPAFIPSRGTGFTTEGVAVQPQYLFWSTNNGTTSGNAIGRANANGSGVNQTLIPAANPGLLAAAPSNKITVNSITRKVKKGTAIIDAKVPGPGQLTLSQTPGTQDVNATAAAIKQIGLTVTQASSFQLPIKPVGKTRKKLNRQIKKQLHKKRRAKAKVKTQAFLTFVPAGVAGVPNTDPIRVTLVRQARKKHRK